MGQRGNCQGYLGESKGTDSPRTLFDPIRYDLDITLYAAYCTKHDSTRARPACIHLVVLHVLNWTRTMLALYNIYTFILNS